MSEQTTTDRRAVEYMRSFRKDILPGTVIGNSGYLHITAFQLRQLGELFQKIFRDGIAEGRKRCQADIKKIIDEL